MKPLPGRQLVPSHTLQDWLEKEFLSSGIPADLWGANITTESGWPLLELLLPDLWAKQRQQTYVNSPTRRSADRFATVMEHGAWVAKGWQPAGIDPTPIIKPMVPRIDRTTGKTIKYETPKGAAALPYFAWVPYACGLKIAKRQGAKELKAYRARIDGKPLEAIDSELWPWAIERGWTITITEGAKKSLSLIGQGILAIGLRGITQWRLPKTDHLSPSLKAFATKGRKWFVALDQDTKSTTRAAVRGQILKMGRAIERKGGKVSVIEWQVEQGKGIDDVIVAAGGRSAEVLAELVATARTLTVYKKDLEAVLKAIATAQSFSDMLAARSPRLSGMHALGAGELLAIDASMGTGKTYQIINSYIKPAKPLGRLVVVLAPNNNLGKQFSQSADLPHMHDYGTRSADVEALKADIYHRGGVVLCMDSLHRLLAICPNLPEQRPLLVIDEVAQTLANFASAGTLGRRLPEASCAFQALVQGAIAIVVAEFGIPKRCLELIDSAREGQPALKLQQMLHRHIAGAWPVKMYKSPRDSGFLASFIAAVAKGGKHFFATTSKAKAKQLEAILQKTFPAKKTIRVDSETTEGGALEELFRNPDEWLRANEVDVIITTPTLQSGVSIDGDKTTEESYFSHVWGHFPTLAPDLHMQMLARVRPAVERHIWIPESIMRSAAETSPKPWLLRRFWQQDAEYQAGIHGLDAPKELSSWEQSLQDFHAQSLIVSGLQKSIAFEYLKHKLAEEGHQIEVVEIDTDKATAQILREARESIENAEAEAIALATIDPATHTPDWARSEIGAISSTVASRRLASKVLARERFPEQLFDDAASCLPLVANYGELADFAELQAAAEDPKAQRALERSAVMAILGASTRNYSGLPRLGHRAQILHDIGILDLINSGEEYSAESELVKAIAVKALERERLIAQFFRLVVTEGQTPVEICHKILKKLGYTMDRDGRAGAITATKRTGPIGKQVQWYRIGQHPDPQHERLLMAARARRGIIAVICEGEESTITNHCNNTQTTTPGQLQGEGADSMPWAIGDFDREEDFFDDTGPPDEEDCRDFIEAIDAIDD